MIEPTGDRSIEAEVAHQVDTARSDASELTSAVLADALDIRERAESDARELVETERERVASDIEVLRQLKVTLESECHDLNAYRDEVRQRVQGLAELLLASANAGSAMPATTELDGDDDEHRDRFLSRDRR